MISDGFNKNYFDKTKNEEVLDAPKVDSLNSFFMWEQA